MNNIGTLWTPEEESQLLEELQQQIPITDIAKKHGRTEKAIRMRIESMIKKQHQRHGYTVSTLMSLYSKSEQEIKAILSEESQSTSTSSSSHTDNPSNRKWNTMNTQELTLRFDHLEKLLHKILKKLEQNKIKENCS